MKVPRGMHYDKKKDRKKLRFLGKAEMRNEMFYLNLVSGKDTYNEVHIVEAPQDNLHIHNRDSCCNHHYIVHMVQQGFVGIPELMGRKKLVEEPQLVRAVVEVTVAVEVVGQVGQLFVQPFGDRSWSSCCLGNTMRQLRQVADTAAAAAAVVVFVGTAAGKCPLAFQRSVRRQSSDRRNVVQPKESAQRTVKETFGWFEGMAKYYVATDSFPGRLPIFSKCHTLDTRYPRYQTLQQHFVDACGLKFRQKKNLGVESIFTN